MNPIKTAVWIAKFLYTLALLFVVIPAAVYIGGLWAIAYVQERQQPPVQPTVQTFEPSGGATPDVFDRMADRASCEKGEVVAGRPAYCPSLLAEDVMKPHSILNEATKEYNESNRKK